MDKDFLNKIINITYLLSLEVPINIDMYDGIVGDECPYCNNTSHYEGSSLIRIIEVDLVKNTFYCRECGIHRTAVALANFMNDYNDYSVWEKLKEALKE